MSDDFDPLPRRPSTPVEKLLDWLLQPTVLLLLSFSVAAWVFVPKLQVRLPELGNDRQYWLATSKIEIPPPPDWVPHDLAAQVAQRAGLPEELSLLDPDVALRRVGLRATSVGERKGARQHLSTRANASRSRIP